MRFISSGVDFEARSGLEVVSFIVNRICTRLILVYTCLKELDRFLNSGEDLRSREVSE